MRLMTSIGSMEHKMSIVRWGDLFSMDLPANWSWSDDEGVIGVFRAQGVGALQISVLSRKDRALSTEEASILLTRDFIHQRTWDIEDDEIEKLVIQGVSATVFEFVEHGDNPTYWQVWHLVGTKHAAFITYMCDPADSEVEEGDRRRIIESLRWL